MSPVESAPATAPRAEALARSFSGAELARVVEAARRSSGDLSKELVDLYQEKLAELPQAEARGRGRLDPAEDWPPCVYSLLKVLIDDQLGWPRWRAISAAGERRWQREHAVLALWRALDDGGPGESYVRRDHFSLSYHRHRLFEWLLGRYQLTLARKVWLGEGKGKGWIARVHYGLLALVLGVFAWRAADWPGMAGHGGWPLLPLLLVAPAYAVVLGVQMLAFRRRCTAYREALAVACQSLIPRLAAAAAVGALALASSQDLLDLAVTHSSPWRFAALTSAGLLYVMVEMFRRLQPLPGSFRVAALVAGVAATAFTHSLALALVLEPGLRQVLGRAGALTSCELMNVAAFFFTIGLTVNLIWAEESVTQPL